MSWNITKLIVTGGFGALYFLLWLPSVTIFSISGGNPIGAIMSLFLEPMINIILLLTVKTFGAVTIRKLISNLLEVPLPKVFPSFMVIPNSLIYGLTSDFLFTLLKNKEKLASLIIGGLGSFYYATMSYILYRLIGFSGIEKIPLITFFLTPIGLITALTTVFVIGACGGYSGFLIYKKIEKTTVVRRIQGGS